MLVLKTIHAELWPEAATRLHEAAAGRDDILIIDGFFSSLIRTFSNGTDCYVSLHRAEGLGLTIASAMSATGIPAIATGWSGNLRVHDRRQLGSSCRTSYATSAPTQPYPADAIWAGARSACGRLVIRALFEQPNLATRLGGRGRDDLTPLAAHGAGAEWLVQRSQDVTQTRIF